MSETISLDSAITLIKAGLFVQDQLVGVTKDNHAVYAGAQRTPIVRVKGPRPDGVEVYRGLMGTLLDATDEQPKRRRTRHG